MFQTLFMNFVGNVKIIIIIDIVQLYFMSQMEGEDSNPKIFAVILTSLPSKYLESEIFFFLIVTLKWL